MNPASAFTRSAPAVHSAYHLPLVIQKLLYACAYVPLPLLLVYWRLPLLYVPVLPERSSGFNVAKLLVGESVSWLTAAVMLVEVAQLLALPEVSVPSALPVPNESLNPFVPYAAHGDAVLYVIGRQ